MEPQDKTTVSMAKASDVPPGTLVVTDKYYGILGYNDGEITITLRTGRVEYLDKDETVTVCEMSSCWTNLPAVDHTVRILEALCDVSEVYVGRVGTVVDVDMDDFTVRVRVTLTEQEMSEAEDTYLEEDDHDGWLNSPEYEGYAYVWAKNAVLVFGAEESKGN